MANVNGNHYRDHRRVDMEVDERRRNHNRRIVGVSNGVSTIGNSLSLEELFINGVGGTGNHHRHYRPDSSVSSQDIIRLNHPRPDVLRARNEYVHVAKTAPDHHRQSIGDQSDIHFLTTLPNRDGMDRLQTDHRANSVPLSVSTTTSVIPGTGSVHNCPYCIGRPLLSNVNFDRLTIAESSKSISTSGNSCRRTTINKSLPIPGRVIRISNSAKPPPNTSSTVISSQPRNFSLNHFEKNGANSNGDCCGISNVQNCSSSIICKNCGRCRCTACTTPRTLPSRSICNDFCILSKENVVDAVSCMCCVKGCLYHAGINSDDRMEIRRNSKSSCDDPIRPVSSSLWSCSPFGTTNCLLRWTALTSALFCLPCIWCYFPMKLFAVGFESTYSRYHNHGCRCDGGMKLKKSIKKRSSRSTTREMNGRGGEYGLSRHLKRKRSHTLPPELPSIAAAKSAAACNGDDGTNGRCCDGSNYS